MAHPGDLGRLTLAAVRGAKELPVTGIGHPITGVPELGCDTCINGIFKNFPRNFAILDFMGNLTGELEIEAFVVNTPALVGTQVQPVLNSLKQLFQLHITGQ